METTFMVQHYGQHYDMIVGARSTWSQLDDWLDERNLPGWVIKGTIA